MTRAQLALSVLLPLCLLPQLAAGQTAEALAAADRLIQVQDVVATMNDMATTIAATLPAATDGQKRAFISEMTAPQLLDRYKGVMRSSLAKHMTVEELNALSDFYSKPIAKSAMRKMGATTAELMPFIQGEIPAIIARVSKAP